MVKELVTKETNYRQMTWIAIDNLSDASVHIKGCKMEEALTRVQIAQDALKEMYVEKKDPLVKHLLAGVSYIQSLLYITKDSLNAADHVSRIGGMLEVLVVVMRG